MARRSDHSKEELEELIFTNASKLIEKHGLDGLSARKLATKIKYTPGTIYSFYKNLDELILKINADSLDQLYNKLQEASSKSSNSKDALLAIAKAYIRYSLDNHNRWKTLYEFSYPQATNTKLPVWYETRIDKNFALLEEQFKTLCKESINIPLQAKIFWSTIHGIALLTLSGKMDNVKVKSVNSLIEVFCETYSKGLKSK